MEVVICEEVKLTFKDVQSKIHHLQDGSRVTSYISTVSIPPIKVDQRLLDCFKSHRVTTKLKVGDTTAKFGLFLGGPDVNKKGVGPGYIRLTGGDYFFNKAFEADPDWINQLKIQVTLTPLQLSGGSFKMELADSSYSFKSGQETMLFNVNLNSDTAEFWNRTWFRNSWTTAVTVKIQFPPVIKQCRAVADPLAAASGLLCDEVLADTTVIAANKAEIKFHRCFLAVQSPVFEKMFQADMKEARTGILELPDMSEECVQALKMYLYVGDVSAPGDNSVLWFELFKAGHKYAIQSVEAVMEQMFLDMDVEWCSADVALGVFLFVKDLEFPQLKWKAVQVLKSKRKELKELPRCRKLIKEEDANVVLELMECLAQDFI